MGHEYTPPSPPLTPRTSQKVGQRIVSCSCLNAYHSEDLPGHLHRICALRLSNGSRLILKTSPPPSVCLLREEYTYLDTEATIFKLLASTTLPVPRIIKYVRRGSHVSAPYLLITYLRGTRYAEALPHLTRAEREAIELQLRSLRSIVRQQTSLTFGPAAVVKAGEGFDTWTKAFTAMLESVLMDGEDTVVNIPYFQIREAVSKCETYLDDVKEATLLVPGFGSPENTLIERETNEVTGVLDFGQAFWGDVGMSDERGDEDVKGLL